MRYSSYTLCYRQFESYMYIRGISSLNLECAQSDHQENKSGLFLPPIVAQLWNKHKNCLVRLSDFNWQPAIFGKFCSYHKVQQAFNLFVQPGSQQNDYIKYDNLQDIDI